jgi:hypothetical protein
MDVEVEHRDVVAAGVDDLARGVVGDGGGAGWSGRVVGEGADANGAEGGAGVRVVALEGERAAVKEALALHLTVTLLR